MNCDTCKYQGVSDVCRTCQHEVKVTENKSTVKYPVVQYVSMDMEVK